MASLAILYREVLLAPIAFGAFDHRQSNALTQ
jgi:hypothetical protein